MHMSAVLSTSVQPASHTHPPPNPHHTHHTHHTHHPPPPANVMLKRRACRLMSLLAARALSASDRGCTVRFRRFLDAMPVPRLQQLTTARLDVEREELPASSMYLKSLIELLSLLKLAEDRAANDPPPNGASVVTPRGDGTVVDVRDDGIVLVELATVSTITKKPMVVEVPVANVAAAEDPERESAALDVDMAMVQPGPGSIQTPNQPLTALRFGGGCSYIEGNRQDMSKPPWTAEFWVVPGRPGGGSRLAGSNHGGLLLTTGPASGRPGCVGWSSGTLQYAFDFQAPRGKVTHLAYVATSSPSPALSLYANGSLVGAIPVIASCPMSTVGDPKYAFRGVLLGARCWRVALQASQVAASTAGGPMARISQRPEDCTVDWDLQDGHGCNVHDRSGGSPASLSGATWVRAPKKETAGVTAKATAPATPGPRAMVLSEAHGGEGLATLGPTDASDDSECVTVVGVWQRSACTAAGGGVSGGRWGKADKEPVTLTYWNARSSPTGDGAPTTVEDEKEDEAGWVSIEGDLTWCDSAISASVKGRLNKDSASLSFSVVRITEWGRNSEVNSSNGQLVMNWLERATFNGSLSGTQMEGTWAAPLHVEPPPVFPTAVCRFSSQRHSTHIEVSDDCGRVEIERSDEQWGTAMLCHSAVGEVESNGAVTDSHDLSNRTGHVALVRSALVVAKAAALTREGEGASTEVAAPVLRSNQIYYECTVGAHKAWRLGWMQVKCDTTPPTAPPATAALPPTPAPSGTADLAETPSPGQTFGVAYGANGGYSTPTTPTTPTYRAVIPPATPGPAPGASGEEVPSLGDFAGSYGMDGSNSRFMLWRNRCVRSVNGHHRPYHRSPSRLRAPYTPYLIDSVTHPPTHPISASQPRTAR